MRNKLHWYRFAFSAKDSKIGTVDWGFSKKDYITSEELKDIEAKVESANCLSNVFITSKMYLGYMTEAEFNCE